MATTTKERANSIGSRILFGTLATAALAGLTAAACEKGSVDPAAETGTFYGPSAAIGTGNARVYVTMADGIPVELGVALSEGALENLPHDHTSGGVQMPDGHSMFELVLELPANNPTPFRHVGFNWNPAGHEPPGIYDLPHFDFHFYTMPMAQRMAIDPTDPEFEAKAANLPAAAFTPPGYIAPLGAVPFMGTHWIDPTSPELNGQTFTQTLIYGSWDGAMTFVEPMITRAFIASKTPFQRTLPAIQRYATPGYYPGTYEIRWDAAAKEYRISLGGFAWRS